jgi:hypothetical protein
MIRDYRPEDLAQIKDIHDRMGIDYQLPDLDSPLCIVRKVEEFDGVIVGALIGRIEVETMLWLHPELEPAEKVETIKRLHEPYISDLWKQGIDNVVCWIEDTIERRFRKRLQVLGWAKSRDGWRSWTRATSEDGIQ